MDGFQVLISEEAERSSRSSVSDVDEFMAWYLVRKYKATGMKSKRVVSLESGCALPGIVCGLLGAHVVLGEKKDLFHLLEKTVSVNAVESDQFDVREFDWADELPARNVGGKFNDFVITTAPLDWSDLSSMDKVLETFVKLSGNGTRLIWGYKKPKDVDTHNEIRRRLDKHFDLKMSRQAIFDSGTHEVIILSVARRPFSSFLEQFLEYSMGVSDPVIPKASPIVHTPLLDKPIPEETQTATESPQTQRSRLTLSSVSITSAKS
eukprot:TRINITY_DN7196_c0_g1_i1.p1 TRINITY_DN7196_c0_g1~~TRINITY_DN7196_c0_g1_i1.p1  ORF type:complete len:299 (+),score=51.58 TRINITY_DN7196_c0_g1_i1:107-898(+)